MDLDEGVMNVLPTLIGSGLVIAAVVWSMIIGAKRKKCARWNQIALLAARSAAEKRNS